MSLKVDKIQLDIIINSDESRKKLNALYTEASGLQKEMKKWKEGTEEYVAASEKLKTVQTNIDVVKREIGVMGMTLKELTDHQRELNMVMRNMDPNIPQYQLLKQEAKEVGDRISELRGKAKGVGADLAQSGNAFTKALGGIQAKVKEWGATVVAAFGIHAIGEFFKDAGKEAVAAEKSIQQYGFAIKKIAGGSEEDFKRLAEQARKLMGIFSHEEIETAGKKMIDFGLSIKEVEGIMPLMVDAAAQSGKTLEELATAIDKGKESGIQIRSILGQLGINFKDTGDKAKNFQLIQEGLTKFTGGNSLALQTNWGRLKNLQTQWNEFKETLGEKFFGDTSSGIIGGLTSMAMWLRDNATSVMNLIKAVGALVVGLTVYKGTELAISAIQKIKLDYQAIALARTKAQTIATNAQIIATEGEIVATEGAAVAQEGLNTAVKSNPIGLVLSVIATVVALIWEYAASTKQLTEDQKKFNEIQEETKNKLEENKRISQEQMMTEKTLFKALKDEKITHEEKLAVLGKINAMLKTEHIPMLLSEKSSVEDVTRAEDALSKSILNNMQLRANQIQLEAKMKLGAEALIAAERAENEMLIAKNVAKSTSSRDTTTGVNTTVRDYTSTFMGESNIIGWSEAWSDILKDALKAGDIELDDNLKDIAGKLKKRSEEFKKTAEDYAKQAEKYQVADKKTGEGVDELTEKWKTMSLSELEAEKTSGVRADNGTKFSKKELANLNDLIRDKKKSYSEGIRDDKKYTEEWEKLQEEMKTLQNENFSETLSVYDKEIKAINEKYDKMIEAEKKFIADVAMIKDPKVRASFQGDVNTANSNIKQLEVEKNAQLDKIIVQAETDLAKEVLDINKKIARAMKSLQEQQLQDIDDHYDKMITDARDAETAVYNDKLKAINSEVSSEEDKATKIQELNKWHADQLAAIQKQADIVNKERDKEKSAATVKNTEETLKKQEELYKKYHLLDENSNLESDRKAALVDLDSHKIEFKTEADFLEAKAKLNKEFDDKELAAKTELTKKKIEGYKKYFNFALEIENSLSGSIQSLKQMELDKAGDNEEKKKAINKKYADIEMAVTISKIITQTALAAITAEAELGPIAGSIMAGLIIAGGVVELGVAIAERNKVKGLESGLYPDYMTMTRAQDGKKFRTKMSRDYRSQRINEPTTFMGGERMPEIMLDGLVTKDLEMNAPVIMNGLKQSIVRVHGVAPGFEQGYYGGLDFARPSGNNAKGGGFDKGTLETMNRFSAAMESMVENGVAANFSIYELEKKQKRYSDAKATFGK